jgi:DNA-binding transcriptional ArsR family regulator
VFDLVEDLSQGVHFTNLSNLSELILAPSYWSTPLVFFDKLAEERMLMTYGARPANASLVPGELVPDALLRGLKALADPTRLRILRYLVDKPLTPAELSRLLRLRAPTVVHHLHALRIAGLVHLYVEEGSDRRYAVRQESTQGLLASLREFLNESKDYPQ